jgi:hypothetical protein
MSSFYPEIDPPERSPIRQFYNDINLKNETRYDVFSAIDTLFEKEGIYEENISSGFVFILLDKIGAALEDPRERLEQYMLIPLTLVSRYVELKQTPVDVKDWYSDLSFYLMLFNKGMHNDTCVSHSSSKNEYARLAGDFCPIRVMLSRMTKDVTEPDFNDEKFILDPDKAYQIATDKVRVLEAKRMLSPAYASFMIDNYTGKYIDYFGLASFIDEPESLS